MPVYGEHAITDASFAQIDREIGAHGFTDAEYAVVRRVIHTTADFEFKQLIQFGDEPIEAADQALRQGQPVITDVSMVAAGITTVMAKTWQSPVAVAVQCADPGFPGMNRGLNTGQTRSAKGMQVCASKYPTRAIFAVGNAPTALLALCEGIAKGKWQPAVVIGTPVGFINVVESKQALAALAVPHILVAGRKGGSAVAAAILNALMIGAWERSP
ncbi:MAG: precorrin-8X methylmutase [Phormidesmis sp.]